MRVPFYIIESPDSFLIQEAVQEFAFKELSEKYKTYSFWADEGLDEKFWNHLSLQGLFAENKLLIIRNAETIPAAKLRELSQRLNRTPDNITTIICLEVEVERSKAKLPAHIKNLPIYKHCQKSGWVKSIEGLNKNTMPRYLQQEAHKRKIILPPPLMAKLVNALPLSAAQISSELDKLTLAAGKDGKVPESVFSVINHSLEGDIFQLLTAMQSGRNIASMWQQLLGYSMSGETLIFAFLAILSREARTLWQILMGERPSLPPSLIPTKRALAQSIGLTGIAKLWELAMSAEKSIKSGEKNPEQAFDLLAAEIYLIFNPRSTGQLRG